MTQSSNARRAAVDLLQQVLERDVNLSEARSKYASGDERDRAFSRHLAYGVLRWLGALEWLAQRMMKKPLKARDRDIHLLVLIGLFQLWKDQSAEHAAVHATAEAARKMGKTWAVGLVNAVLRRFQREQEAMLAELAKTDQIHAFPEWLLAHLQRDWPGDDWKSIVQASNQAAPLWLRMNQRHDTDQAVIALDKAGFRTTAHPVAADAIKIEPSAAVHAIPGFSEGRLSVQDPAAQLAASFLDLKPGERVLDACAAPGGKACHLLEKYPNIEITALDRSKTRLDKVRENLQRLGLNETPAPELIQADAACTEDWWDRRPYRFILLDAPCTATGVIRRHPEIKWLRSTQQVQVAVDSQRRLLKALWPLLEPGGMLLYATCSLLNVENRDQIQHFVSNQPDAELHAVEAEWGRDTGFGRQILPGDNDMDGFFYAPLVRKHQA